MEKIKKNTITFFLPSFEGGGAERNLINILKEIDKKYYNITLILAKRKGVFLGQVPKDILIVDFKGEFLFNIFLKLTHYFYTVKPDIFVSTFPRFNFVNLLSKMFSGSKVKFVIVEQTTPSKLYITAKNFFHKIIAYFFLAYLLKIFYTKANIIICVSNGVKKDLCRFIGESSKIKVIYNPVIKKEIYQLSQENLDHPWLKTKQVPVIIAVGRLVSAKDYPTLLKAFALVFKKRSAQLIILGNGQERKKLEKLIMKLNISQEVNFLGWQENPYKYLSKASVFVNSSRREGFSNAIIEAMACGAPIVSTDCTGPKEIIENNKNGILVPVGDEKLLAKAILLVLDNPSLSKKLSKEGKRRALDFTIKKSVKAYELLFKELIYE